MNETTRQLEMKLKKRKYLLSILLTVALFFAVYPFAMMSGYALDLSEVLFPTIVFLAVAVLALFLTWKVYKSNKKISDEIKKSLAENGKENYYKQKKLYSKIATMENYLIGALVVAVGSVIATGSEGLGVAVFAAVGFVISLLVRLKTKKKLAEMEPISDEDLNEITNEVNAERKKQLYAIIILAVIIIATLASGGSSTSSHSDPSGIKGEPWKELGVSKREYMEIYNKYKYGE